MNYSQSDNLLIQSYLTISFLTELKNINFLDSEYYENAGFKDKFVKENFAKIGIDNQGSLLMFIYAMLVVPRQLLQQHFPTEFSGLNVTIGNIGSKANSTYSEDVNGIGYVRHIRNAVAHAKVSFEPNRTVTFRDENNRGEICSIEIPLDKVGIFLTKLQAIFIAYIEQVKTGFRA